MILKGYLKFILFFIYKFILENPVKMTILAVGIAAFCFAGIFDNEVAKSNVDEVIKVKSGYVYITANEVNGKVEYGVIHSLNGIKLIDGKIVKTEYNIGNVLLWVLFGICSLLLTIGFFMGYSDDDLSWDVSGVISESLECIIYCVEDNGVYYYMILGRLLLQSPTMLQNYEVNNQFRKLDFTNLSHYPKFSTRSQKRESKLNKIIK